MTNGRSLINLGELSKPATVLIKKISNLLGGFFKPYQIKRVAEAEAEAEKTRALAQIEVTEMQRRAFARFLEEEARKQENIEEITRKALPDLDGQARPDQIEDDWISNFFDKCRLVSDEEMQSLWARLLAGEANSPGRYSRRTVNFLSSLDKSDAHLFSQLCGFAWSMGEVVPLVFDPQHEIYTKGGITFGALKHLDEIGFLSFETLAVYRTGHLPQEICVSYCETPVYLRFKNEKDNSLQAGHVLLSRVGQELAPIAGSRPVSGFLEYVLEKWATEGLQPHSKWPNPRVPRMP